MKNEIFSLGIKDPNDFKFECEGEVGEITEYVYDPVSREYNGLRTRHINEVTIREDNDH